MKHLLMILALLVHAHQLWAAKPQVELKTTEGIIVIELFEQQAPQSAANFLEYVRNGHYDGTIFHRVIDGFMIQGGGFTADMRQKATRAPIRNEASSKLKNRAGTVALARTRDPHSATAQFFINLEDNPSLDHPRPDGWGYAVFGAVTQGMEVVRAIGQLPTRTTAGHRDVPVEPVIIEAARLIDNGSNPGND